MKPNTLKLIYLFASTLSFYSAQSQYRLLIHDKLHNSYTEAAKNNKFTIISSDSIMRTGFISAVNSSSVVLNTADSSYTLQLADIVNVGVGTSSNKGARVTTRIIGYVLTSFGAIMAISTISALSESETQAAAIVGVVGAAGITGGILMIRSSYKEGGNNRDFLTRPRYNFRIVKSAF